MKPLILLAFIGAPLLTGDIGCGGDSRPQDGRGSHEDTTVDTGEDASTATDTGVVIDSSGVDSQDAELSEDAGDTLPPSPPAQPPLFGRSALAILNITLSGAAQGLLAQSPQTSVPAVISLGDDLWPQWRVSLVDDSSEQVPGRDLTGKPSILLHINSSQLSQAQPEYLAGIERLELDAMHDDPSQLTRCLAHLLYERLGVAVPRAAFVRVTMDDGDQDLGLYCLVEPLTQESFLARHEGRGPGEALLSAVGRVDLWPWQIERYERLVGDENATVDLASWSDALADIQTQVDTNQSYDLGAALAPWVDMDAVLRVSAVDMYLGRVSNYQYRSRSYSWYRPQAGSPWSLVPDDLQWTFKSWQNPWYSAGRLVGICLDHQACRARYASIIRAVQAQASVLDIQALAFAVSDAVAPWSAADPRKEYPVNQVLVAQAQLSAFLAARDGWLDANMACSDPASVDRDLDGFSECIDDCNDEAIDVHPGAPEACNLRDDNCNGILDDKSAEQLTGAQAEEPCPSCVERVGPQGQARWFCYHPLPWTEATDACALLGGKLASIHSSEDMQTLRSAAVQLQYNSWWLGLSDANEEGIFAWSDGSPLDFEFWSPHEPNDSNGEDCGHMRAWDGRWNDLDCERSIPYICDVAHSE